MTALILVLCVVVPAVLACLVERLIAEIERG